MNVTSIILLAGILVVAGQWAQGKNLDIKIGIGVAFVAIALSAMAQANQELAVQFAWLIFVGAFVFNGIPLFKAIKGVTS